MPNAPIFHLRVGVPNADGRYPIAVLDTPNQSKTRNPVHQQMPWEALDIDLKLYNQLMLHETQARHIGIALSRFLFPPRIRSYLNDALQYATERGVPLHIRLQIEPQQLQALPWELIYDTTRGLYWANGQTSTLTRYLPLPHSPRPAPTPTPLRVLLALASPTDLLSFDIEKSAVRIQRALQPLGDAVELTVLSNASADALHNAVVQNEPHVLHLVGHGRSDGIALSAEETGKTQVFDKEQMRVLLDGRSIRVVLITACDSAKLRLTTVQESDVPYFNLIESALHAGVAAAVGMQTPLPVRAAQKLNRALYHALVAGRPLDQALGEARVNLFTTGNDKLYWSVPVLHLRTSDGVVWQPPRVELPLLAPALKPYLELVVRRSGRLPLGAIDPAGQESGHMMLGQVFIHLDADVSVRVERPLGRPVIVRQSEAIGHAFTHRQLILLGDPGSGKSTLLRFMATCFAEAILQQSEAPLTALRWREDYLETQEDLLQDMLSMLTRENLNFQQQIAEWRGAVPIPILIELRNFARAMPADPDPLALWRYASDQLEALGLQDAIGALDEAVKNGRAIFLLDGVDEVPIVERKLVWQAIQALERGALGGNRWIATCRILSFAAHEAPSGVASRTLQSLDALKIEQFVASWYDALCQVGQLSQTQALRLCGRLQNALRRPQLQTLAENPMLLTIMALVQTYHGTLPEGRARLYQMCVETLLLRWQRHKEEASGSVLPGVLAQLDISQQDLERLLWEIAWTAHKEAEDRETAADIPESELLDIARDHLGSLAKAEQFLAYTEERAHLLVSRGGTRKRVYTFPHRTFEEYLAACYLASQRRFPRMALQLAKQKETWREVLTLAAGTLVYNQNNFETVIDAVKEMLPRNPPKPNSRVGWYRVWLAAEMMVTVGKQAAEKDEVGREVMPKLRAQLVALLEASALNPPQRAAAGEALGNLGDPRRGVETLEPALRRVAGFMLAIYPVTNAQFRNFISQGGYQNRRFWSIEGWRWRCAEKISLPCYWEEPPFDRPNQPVVGVSWYEAAAYCAWLSENTKRPYRLPTADEWRLAASGAPGLLFPWGNAWANDRANSQEAKIYRPSVVGLFPLGAAPFGGFDLAGNVREWSADSHLDDGVRLVCGGSWNDKRAYLQNDFVLTVLPHQRRDTIGFRVAQSL